MGENLLERIENEKVLARQIDDGCTGRDQAEQDEFGVDGPVKDPDPHH